MSKFKLSAYGEDDYIFSGEYGIRVYAGNLLKTVSGNKKQSVAVIRIQLANVERGRIPDFEKNIMKKVNENPNPHILLYLHIEMDDYFLFLATDRWTCTLKQLVEGKFQEQSITGKEKTILLQITRGVDYLHSKGIIHRDLNPTNIVCNFNGSVEVKLAHFGICSTLIRSINKIPLGLPGWIAPESFQLKDSPITSKCDIFSLGLIFFYVLTVNGKHPFGALPLDQALEIQKLDDTSRTIYFGDSTGCLKRPYRDDSEAIIKLIRSMCKKSPEKRLTANEVLNNIFFEKLLEVEQPTVGRSPPTTPQKRKMQTVDPSNQVRKSSRLSSKSPNKTTSPQTPEHHESSVVRNVKGGMFQPVRKPETVARQRIRMLQ